MDELYFLNTEQTGTVSLTFRMKLVKYVLVSRSDFPGVSGGILKEKSLARRGKTNIVHAPPRLAEVRVVRPERLF